MKKDRDEPAVEKIVVADKVVAEQVVPQKPESANPSEGAANPTNEKVINRVESTERGDASDTSA